MPFKINNIHYQINGNKILDNINVEFEQYKFNSIIGPNGCGKSTLIKLLARIDKPNVGKIIYFDEELSKIKRKEFAKEVAFFFQFNNQIDDITVEQMITFGRSPHKKLYQNLNECDLRIIDNVIEKCELKEFRNRRLNSLSGGEKQRVHLAMVLAQEPKVLILDEPTNHLDIKYQFQLLKLINDFMKENKITVICILHDFNQVFKYANTTTIIKDGSIYANGKTDDVLTQKSIKEVFEVDSLVIANENGIHVDFIV